MSFPAQSRLFEKQENEDKFVDAVQLAAKSLERFVDVLDKSYKLIVRRIEADDVERKGRRW